MSAFNVWSGLAIGLNALAAALFLFIWLDDGRRAWLALAAMNALVSGISFFLWVTR